MPDEDTYAVPTELEPSAQNLPTSDRDPPTSCETRSLSGQERSTSDQDSHALGEDPATSGQDRSSTEEWGRSKALPNGHPSR